jgi:hypothetical protein
VVFLTLLRHARGRDYDPLPTSRPARRPGVSGRGPGPGRRFARASRSRRIPL